MKIPHLAAQSAKKEVIKILNTYQARYGLDPAKLVRELAQDFDVIKEKKVVKCPYCGRQFYGHEYNYKMHLFSAHGINNLDEFNDPVVPKMSENSAGSTEVKHGI